MKLWKYLNLTWLSILLIIIVYSILVPGGITDKDYSRFLGLSFWSITLILSFYPIGYIAKNWKKNDYLQNVKNICIAILCPFVGSVYLFFKLTKSHPHSDR